MTNLFVVKYDDSKSIIYDANLRRIIRDLANADNFEEEDFEPEYRQPVFKDYTKHKKYNRKS